MAEADTEVLDAPGGDAPVETSRADDIGAAFDKLESEIREPAAPPPGGTAESPPAASPGDRARGPDGRFLEAPAKPLEKPQGAPPPDPGGKASTPAAAQQRQAAQAAAAAQAVQAAQPLATRAPQTWRPQAREHWSKLPPDVQAEVTRRETEVGRALQESARARDAVSQVQQVLAPFQANIQASGGDAMGAIATFFRTDNTLRHGSTTDKATMVADIIKNYGVDLQTLDSILAGQHVAPDPASLMRDNLRQEMRRELQPVMQFFNQMQGRQREAMNTITSEASSEVENFGVDHEFFEDVRGDMADIIDMFTARGQQISLQQAYDRAIMLNPQIAEIVSKRAEADRVSKAAQAAQRARRTAASIGGSPAPAGSPGPVGDDRRAALEAAWESSSSS